MAFNGYTLGTEPQNRHNFIRWYKVNDPTYSAFPVNQWYGYSCREEYPVIATASFLASFTLTFYANLKDLDATSDTSNWDLVGIDEDDTIVYTFGGSFATKDVITGSSFRFYRSTGNPVIPVTMTRLAIYNSVGNDLLYRSNQIASINNSRLGEYTHVKYRNSTSLYNINYTTLTTYYNQLYLPIEFVSKRVESNGDSYRLGNTGNYRNSAFESDMVWTFRVRRLDAENHEAFLAMLLHDEVYFNGKRFTYRSSSPYESNILDNININNGIFQMNEYDFSLANKDRY